MKNKIIGFIAIFTIALVIFFSSSDTIAFANTYNQQYSRSEFIEQTVPTNILNNDRFCAGTIYWYNNQWFQAGNTVYEVGYYSMTFDSYWGLSLDPYGRVVVRNQTYTDYYPIAMYEGSYLYVVLEKGSPDAGYDDICFSSYDDMMDHINGGDLTWFEELFTWVLDYFNNFGLDNPGVLSLFDWFTDLWNVRVGEGEEELILELETTPSPTPTPTPIPYQTNLTPDGNGGFTIQYIYNDPSGIPTSAPQPPSNNITNNYGSDFEYPYYKNPNDDDDPYQLDIPWYLKFVFNNTTTSLSDMQKGMDAAVENVNDQSENINVVMDSMSVFPADWLMIIGFIGAIPLVGGIISRLLKG